MNTTPIVIKRDYAPLVCSVTLKPSSPPNQTYNGTLKQHEPSYAVTPLIIRINATASASDGSWTDTDILSKLVPLSGAGSIWYIDGHELTDADDGFSISQKVGADKNALILSKDRVTTVSTAVTVQLRARFADTRAGMYNVTVESNVLTLTCQVSAESRVTLEAQCDNRLAYDDTLDPLLLHEYELAKGFTTPLATAQEEALMASLKADRASYAVDIPLVLRFGKSIQPTTSYTVQVFPRSKDVNTNKVGVAQGATPIAANGKPFTYIGSDKVSLDMRCVDDSAIYGYEIRATHTQSGRVVSAREIFPHRRRSPIRVKTMNQAFVRYNQTERCDKVIATVRNRVIPHPEMFLDLQWQTKAQGQTDFVTRARGARCRLNLNTAGLTQSANILEARLQYNPTNKVMPTDSGGVQLIGGDGNPYVITEQI